MPVPLPQLQPKAYTPKPAIPFAEPPARTPVSFKVPKGVKPGQVTYPFRMNPPPVKPPSPPPTIGVAAGKVAKGAFRLGKGGFAAIAFELLFPPPAGDNYYDRNPKNPPPKYKLQPSEPAREVEPPDYPFYGGQSLRVAYTIIFKYRQTENYLGTIYVVERENRQGGFYGINSIFVAKRGDRVSLFVNCNYHNSPTAPGGDIELYGQTANITLEILSLKIERGDGQPDIGGNPPPRNQPIISAPGNSLGAPSAAPPSAAPSPAPLSIAPAPQPKRYPEPAPGSNPEPAPQPKRYLEPAPVPSPGPTPQPQLQLQRQPDPLPQPFPFAEPAPRPGLNLGAPPGSSPSPTPAPAPTAPPSSYRSPPFPDPTDYPDTGFQPDILTPNPLTPNLLAPSPFVPNPDTGNPEPRAPLVTLPPRSPDPNPNEGQQLQDQIRIGLGAITTILAVITALVQPNAIKASASAATCEAFSPTGCAAPVANNAAAAANNSANNNVLLAQILAFLQALQATFMAPILAGVELINTKLGPVMAGVNGIGGFLGRLNTSLGVDRVINLVTTAGVIHNCMMLSSSISDTLFSTLDNVFVIPSLIKDPAGATVDSKEVFTKHLDGMFAKLFGTTEWIAIKNQWKAYSTIYNTCEPVFGNIRDIFDETSQIQEVTKNWVAELGNGLQDEGLIGENNCDVKDPKKSIKGKYFARLQRIAEGLEQVENVAEDLAQITSSACNIVETANEIKENTATISKAVNDANKAAKLDREAKEEGLELPNFSLEDLF